MKLKGLTYSDGKNHRYYYLRSGGKKIPLGRGPINSPEFLAQYVAAWKEVPKQRRRAKERSIAALCEAFKSSTTYATYSRGYKSIFLRHMDAICGTQAKAEAKVSDLCSRHIRYDLEPLTPNVAKHRLKVWRALCQLAFERGWTEKPATDGVKAPKIPKTEGHVPWDASDIATYRAYWPVGSVQRVCFELLYWTGARTVDAVRLSPSMIGSDGFLTFTQSKTNHKAHVPWTCSLADWAQDFNVDLEYLHEVLPTGSFTFLETSTGRARSHKGLSNLISSSAKMAGIEQKTAHGLRKTRLTSIAEAGGTIHAIQAWGGHKTVNEVQEYIATADRKKAIKGT